MRAAGYQKAGQRAPFTSRLKMTRAGAKSNQCASAILDVWERKPGD